MKAQGFTLVELLAVIVILAIIALIATPIVLGIIDDTKESAQLRSAEMYLKGVANAVMRENMNSGGNFRPTECSILDGNMSCDSTPVEVEVDGEKPKNGNITFEEGKIKEVRLEYANAIIVKNEEGNLVYSDDENGNSSEKLDLSTVNTDLATNTWEDVQKIVQAGKSVEAGWAVGDTKTLEINGQINEATIIGIDHDGENTATFMVMSNIGSHVMNSTATNVGGWEASEMRAWLNNDIYNSMTDVKDYIKEVTKLTDNVGYSETHEAREATTTYDKVFLLSAVEVGLGNQIFNDYKYLSTFNNEGTVYKWFKEYNLTIHESGEISALLDNDFLLRSPYSDSVDYFFYYCRGYLSKIFDWAAAPGYVLPAFVIG